MEYKVTLEKCKEHLGEQLYGVLEPWKSPLMKQKLGALAFMIIVIALILLLNKLYWQPLVIIVLAGIWLVPYGKSSVQEQYKKELAERILLLVNDHELLWLNFVYPKKTIKRRPIRLGRDNRSEIKETTIKALAFLKKEGTSQGLHKFIVGFQGGSSSANKHLGRLYGKKPSERKLVEHTGNDYWYIPWQFMLIDEFENRLPEEENRKIETLLSEAFEDHLDSYYPVREKMTPWERMRWYFRERNKARMMHDGL